MSSAVFVTCPGCERYMLGQRHDGVTYPQPHECTPPQSLPSPLGGGQR